MSDDKKKGVILKGIGGFYYVLADGKEYPFGPFIAVGALVAMLVGDYVLNWYITALIL